MMQNIPAIDSLIKLLDDDDDTARPAMISLMQHYPAELNNILISLQECDNELLRKRSHQLQAIMIFKQRRMDLQKILHGKRDDFYFSDILLELHLLWYEKDSPTELAELYLDLLKKFPADGNMSPFAVTEYLKNSQFITVPDSTANCDLYMIGSVLDNRCGANAFMCAFAAAILEDLKPELSLETILFEHRFYLYDRKSGLICDVLGHWAIRALNFTDFKIFSRRELLKYISSVCFCNAVHEDAFRYVRILCDILINETACSSLPYPYSGNAEK